MSWATLLSLADKVPIFVESTLRNKFDSPLLILGLNEEVGCLSYSVVGIRFKHRIISEFGRAASTLSGSGTFCAKTVFAFELRWSPEHDGDVGGVISSSIISASCESSLLWILLVESTPCKELGFFGVLMFDAWRDVDLEIFWACVPTEIGCEMFCSGAPIVDGPAT